MQGKTAKAYGKVKGVALEMLGRLLHVYAKELSELSNSILVTLADTLKTAYAKDSGQKANVIAGAICGAFWIIRIYRRGYRWLSHEKKKQLYNNVFVCAMNVPEDLSRFGVPVTAMNFIFLTPIIFEN